VTWFLSLRLVPSDLFLKICFKFSVEDYSVAGKDELDALAETETEDPIVKAEREFFEIIKQVSLLNIWKNVKFENNWTIPTSSCSVKTLRIKTMFEYVLTVKILQQGQILCNFWAHI